MPLRSVRGFHWKLRWWIRSNLTRSMHDMHAFGTPTQVHNEHECTRAHVLSSPHVAFSNLTEDVVASIFSVAFQEQHRSVRL